MVADKAGVSKMTASYALRDNEGAGRVSQATIARVKEVARQLNYVPNLMARSLRQQKTNVIGVVLGNLRHDWSARIMMGLDRVLGPADYQSMLLLHHWSVERNIREIETLLKYRVDGIISQPLVGMEETYAKLRSQDIPHILISDALPKDEITPRVLWDDVSATETMVSHLAGLGRKRIALLIQDTNSITAGHRLEAYRSALAKAGLQHDPTFEVWYHMGTSLDDGTLPAIMFPNKIAANRPDAIFAIHDPLALALMRWLRDNGFEVPRDVAVAGLGNLPQSAKEAAGLSTIDEPCEKMGYTAGMILMDIISSREISNCTVVPSGSLHIRSSTVSN